MTISPTRAYTWVASLGLFLQGTITLIANSTLIAPLVPAIDPANLFLMHQVQMIPSHSLLHMASGVIGFATLRFSDTVGPWRFALWFGLFYVVLTIAGAFSGQPLGIGLQPADHPIHAVLGVFGLLAVAVEFIRARAASGGDA